MNSKISHLTNQAWKALPAEIETELGNILHYWEQFAPDYQEGGFIGQIDQDNKIHAGCTKGAVLNARILWSFSAAYRYTRNPRHLELATRAYQYISEFFTDKDSWRSLLVRRSSGKDAGRT